MVANVITHLLFLTDGKNMGLKPLSESTGMVLFLDPEKRGREIRMEPIDTKIPKIYAQQLAARVANALVRRVGKDNFPPGMINMIISYVIDELNNRNIFLKKDKVNETFMSDR
jgi:hypothetical protein